MKVASITSAAVCFLAAGTVAPADVVTIGAAKDASIFSSTPNNSDGGGPGMFAGTDSSGSRLRSLIQFDIAGNVPFGSTITSVQLTLYLGMVVGGGGIQGDQTPRVIELHRLSGSWGEGSTGSASTSIAGTGQGFPANDGNATWLDRLYSATSPISWNTPGGDFVPAASGSATVSQTINAAYQWTSTASLVSDAQSWLDNPSGNDGWLLENTDETDLRTFRAFWTREASNAALRPQLQVTFTAVPEPGTALLLVPAVLIRRRVHQPGGSNRSNAAITIPALPAVFADRQFPYRSVYCPARTLRRPSGGSGQTCAWQ